MLQNGLIGVRLDGITNVEGRWKRVTQKLPFSVQHAPVVDKQWRAIVLCQDADPYASTEQLSVFYLVKLLDQSPGVIHAFGQSLFKLTAPGSSIGPDLIWQLPP
jgi:hypothetical protein